MTLALGMLCTCNFNAGVNHHSLKYRPECRVTGDEVKKSLGYVYMGTLLCHPERCSWSRMAHVPGSRTHGIQVTKATQLVKTTTEMPLGLSENYVGYLVQGVVTYIAHNKYDIMLLGSCISKTLLSH